MKKTLTVLMAVMLLVSLCGAAPAEETAEYRDQVYAFRYPASWTLSTADNGDIVLGPPNGSDGVITFGIITDLWNFTGDAEADGPMIEQYISSYEGKNLALSGEYELMQRDGMRGFRALGSWRATGQDAVMMVLTGNRHMVCFVLVGDGAIALEQSFLNSVELLGDGPSEGAEGFLRWEGSRFALDYPENYGTMEQNTGVVFINPDDTNSIIMARTYDLDFDYADSMAATIAASALPKSTKVEANPEMVEIGGRNAAVIKGTISAGDMAFYVIGSGRTAMALMFTGGEACGMADHIIQSVEIK